MDETTQEKLIKAQSALEAVSQMLEDAQRMYNADLSSAKTILQALNIVEKSLVPHLRDLVILELG